MLTALIFAAYVEAWYVLCAEKTWVSIPLLPNIFLTHWLKFYAVTAMCGSGRQKPTIDHSRSPKIISAGPSDNSLE